MKRIAMIHTVRSVYETFEPQLRAAVPDLPFKVHHLLDEFLATDPSPSESGVFTAANKRRLYYDVMAATLTGADLIVVTCSTLTPTVLEIRPFSDVEILTIDEPMGDLAVRSGRRIALMATAASTVQPSTCMLEAAAQRAGLPAPEIEVFLCEEAMKCLAAGNAQAHDRLLCEVAAGLSGFDTVVLAQASMARAGDVVEAACGLRVLTSPGLCLERIAAFLRE